MYDGGTVLGIIGKILKELESGRLPRRFPAEGNFVMSRSAVMAVSVLVILVLAFAAALFAWRLKKRKRAEDKKGRSVDEIVHTEELPPKKVGNPVGKVHHIGKRANQQDSFGVMEVENGMFAVVADGMGGLSDGDKVSQKIVLTMLQDASELTKGQMGKRPLYTMVSRANREVLRMLAASPGSRSGSTVIAVLTEGSSFQWISVGDSRIYLYHAGQLMQINSEHIYEKELLKRAVNQEVSFAEIQTDKQKKRITSYIGMGEIKHIEGSLNPVKAQAGDKLLLMSDGVFNTLPEQEICRILEMAEDAEEAAEVVKKQVLARQNPRQDNFTAVILEL